MRERPECGLWVNLPLLPEATCLKCRSCHYYSQFARRPADVEACVRPWTTAFT